MVGVTDSETLLATPEGILRRYRRFLIWEFKCPHRVMSTCGCNGGQREDLRYFINHQSCEGAGHMLRHDLITRMGQAAYHSQVCAELELEPSKAALMGTAANMNYAAISQQDDLELRVIAVVTAGVQGNAACAGDPAKWRETDGAWQKVNAFEGTINTMLLINHPVTPSALARAVVTMTEGKSSALHRLAIGSLYSPDEATGTGTDQYCLAAPLTGKLPLSSASPHTKLGELIGRASRSATLEALRWQNGLEASYTRGIFHVFGRYGLSEKRFWEMISGQLPEETLELLRKNSNSVFYEPLVAASAYSFAAVLDRVRYGTFPAATVSECLKQCAALLAANLAAAPQRFGEFKATFDNILIEDPTALIVKAIAAGWSAKWT